MPTTATDVNVPVVSIVPAGALLITLMLTAAACGGSSRAEMSPEAENGRRIANTKGCASCHGSDGTGGVGPKLAGLYGSDVALSDGSTVVADDAYIRRSIIEPEAQRVAGYTLKMPVVGLEADEIEAVLAYIRELGATP